MKIPESYKKSLNVHQIAIEKFFGFDKLVSTKDWGNHLPEIIFICFTNRCGSNFLAELLEATGAFNKAQEILHFDFVEHVCTRQSINYFSDYFMGMIHSNKINDRIVIKASPEQIFMLKEWGILQPFSDRITFLSIERLNKIDQAVSLLIAGQSGQWVSYQEKQTNDVTFNIGGMLNHLTYINRQNDYIAQFFLLNGIVAHKLFYENLVENTEKELASIGTFLNLPSPLLFNANKITVKRQASRLNNLFRDKFISWLGINSE